MKTQYKIMITAVALSIMSGSAFADMDITSKPGTRIDFNKMIDDNNSVSAGLEKSVNDKMDSVQEQDAEKKNVADFVNEQMNFNSNRDQVVSRPTNVDRRFNSIGKARIVDITALDGE